MTPNSVPGSRHCSQPTVAAHPSWMSDLTGAHEPTSPATLEATAASRAETRLPSELATAEDRSDGADFTLAGAPQADRPGGSGVGQVIAGRYTLLEVLGEGGMGTVYRAGQTQPVKRQVALKLIKIGMDSRAVLARFDAERQALALMDHPNIARVYDGGSTEAGQPFFVMELVSGEPITEYCDRLRLPVRARLELFVAVCQAVQHAHQKGIIHRDLKPSNVMVTEVDGRPTPKVIDFGVAKATEFSLTDQSLADTGAIVGTPTYMSPEQADPSSMDIDTRTDVYALGVILYELLVGSPPIDAKQFKRGAILEMLRMVREVDPPRPSTKVSTSDALPSISANRDIEPAHLKRALQGDLDWIVMMALEKDRTRRYETANGFAADIQRHLAHEPVVAAPPSRAYRLRKFVRKHRGAVIAASLVLLALLGGLAAVAAVQTVANARLAGLAEERDECERGPERSQRPAHQIACGGAGAVRAGDGRDQDVSHRRQRGFPAQGGEIQGPAQPAAEIGVRLLWQARCAAGQGDGPGVASGAGAGQLRAVRPDRQGRPQGRRTGCSPAGPRRPRGAGGRAGGGRRDQGRRRPQPHGRGGAPVRGRQDRRGRGDLPQGRDSAGGPGPVVPFDPGRAGRAGVLPDGDGVCFDTTPASSSTRWCRTAWRGTIRRRWPTPPAHRRRPGVTWRQRSIAPPCC